MNQFIWQITTAQHFYVIGTSSQENQVLAWDPEAYPQSPYLDSIQH